MLNEEHPFPFIDQIVEHTLEGLSGHPAFDCETLRRLKQLAESTGLTNFQQIVEALSTGEAE